MASIRTSRNSLVLVSLAFLSYSFGALMPGATGLVPPALIAVGAAYLAMGSDNKTVKFLVTAVAILMVCIAVALNVFVLGLSVESNAL